MKIVKEILDDFRSIPDYYNQDPIDADKFREDFVNNVEKTFEKIKMDLFKIEGNKKVAYSIIHDEVSNKRFHLFLLLRNASEDTLTTEYKNEVRFWSCCNILLSFLDTYLLKDIRRSENGTKKDNNVEIDLSNSSGAEKIVMLEKLGILKFLKEKEPFNLSTNTLASAISGITGIKQKSVYPMINPIFSPSVKQKNNPLGTIKTVNKVKLKLSNIGFDPTE